MMLKQYVIRIFCRGRTRAAPWLLLLSVLLWVLRLNLSSFETPYREALVRKISLLDQVDVVKNLTTDNPVNRKEDDTSLYFQETHMDLPGGDIVCSANETCTNFTAQSPELAQIMCNSYGSRCKGFVYSVESGKFYPKGKLTNKMVYTEGVDLYIKKAYVKKPEQNETCAILPDQFESFVDGCRLPDLDPNDESITKLITKPEPLQCPGFQLTRYQRGVLELTEDASKVGNITSLEYQPIFRPPQKDWGFELGNKVSLAPNEHQFKIDSEFIRVQLTTAQGARHVEYHAQIFPRSPRQEYSKASGLPLSVVIIGFDSLSAAHFQRALPEAYKFMTEQLNSVFLKGYSIVGDGTTPALTALMTGKFESELPEARREFPGTEPLDRWPHIFKDFKSKGYATLFSEDCPVYAAFNYRLHGFRDPPTDHFSRYFWEAAKITSPHCVHSKPQHQIHFDYVKSYVEAYSHQPKFGLFFMTDISHNNLNNVYKCASDFVTLLKDLHQGNALNDTLVIVMSDHGARIGEARATFQGKLEERLPLMAFILPRWFSRQHPNLIHNLKENSDIVTSPFDLYATFRHLLSYPQAPSNLTRGASLFSKISQTRDCESAGVADHYCPCVQWKGIDTRANHARSAARAVVDHVNNFTASDPLALNLCSRLQLQEILSAHQKVPNIKVAQYLGSSDVHGRKPMFSRDDKSFDTCLYQVQLRTVPGNGLYEASVNFDGSYYRVSGDISRINLYGDQPKCILEKNPHLRKYCLCKDYIEQ